MTFTEWLKQEFEKDPDNLCDPPLEAQQAIYFLTDYLLGEEWYVTMPESAEQINTAIVHAILKKYSRKYRKEIRNDKQ